MFHSHHTNADMFPSVLAGADGSRFLSNDRDEVRSYVGRMYCDHSLDLVNARGRLDTRIAQLHCGAVTLTEMSYGADVMIDVGRLENFYLVQVPVAGRSGLTLGGRHDTYGPGRASVQHPQLPLDMFWSADCRKVVLRFDKAAFERLAEAYLGRPLRGCVQFESWFDTDSSLGALLTQQVQSVIGMLHTGRMGETGGMPPLLERHLENTTMAALLFLQPSDVSEELAQPSASVDPVPCAACANSCRLMRTNRSLWRNWRTSRRCPCAHCTTSSVRRWARLPPKYCATSGLNGSGAN